MTKSTVHPLSTALDALGWTQTELSARSGVSQSTISFVLAGKRGGKFSPESARKILDVVGRSKRYRTWRRNVAGEKFPAVRLTLADLVFSFAARS